MKRVRRVRYGKKRIRLYCGCNLKSQFSKPFWFPHGSNVGKPWLNEKCPDCGYHYKTFTDLGDDLKVDIPVKKKRR